MQALSISNIFPVNAPIPSSGNVSSAAPQLPSQFGAIFQTELNGTGNTAKSLAFTKTAAAGQAAVGQSFAAGRPQDSASELDDQDTAPSALNDPDAPIPQSEWTLRVGLAANDVEPELATSPSANASGQEGSSAGLRGAGDVTPPVTSDRQFPPVAISDATRVNAQLADAAALAAGFQNPSLSRPARPSASIVLSAPEAQAQTQLSGPNFAVLLPGRTPSQGDSKNRLQIQPFRQKSNSIQPRVIVHGSALQTPNEASANVANFTLAKATYTTQPNAINPASVQFAPAARVEVDLNFAKPVPVETTAVSADATPVLPASSARNPDAQSNSRHTALQQSTLQQILPAQTTSHFQPRSDTAAQSNSQRAVTVPTVALADSSSQSAKLPVAAHFDAQQTAALFNSAAQLNLSEPASLPDAARYNSPKPAAAASAPAAANSPHPAAFPGGVQNSSQQSATLSNSAARYDLPESAKRLVAASYNSPRAVTVSDAGTSVSSSQPGTGRSIDASSSRQAAAISNVASQFDSPDPGKLPVAGHNSQPTAAGSDSAAFVNLPEAASLSSVAPANSRKAFTIPSAASQFDLPESAKVLVGVAANSNSQQEAQVSSAAAPANLPQSETRSVVDPSSSEQAVTFSSPVTTTNSLQTAALPVAESSNPVRAVRVAQSWTPANWRKPAPLTVVEQSSPQQTTPADNAATSGNAPQIATLPVVDLSESQQAVPISHARTSADSLQSEPLPGVDPSDSQEAAPVSNAAPPPNWIQAASTRAVAQSSPQPAVVVSTAAEPANSPRPATLPVAAQSNSQQSALVSNDAVAAYSAKSGRLLVAVQHSNTQRPASQQPVPQETGNLPAVASNTFAHTAGRTASIGGASHRFQESGPGPTTSQAQPSPNSASAAKSPAKDASYDTPGNASNAKPEPGSNGAAVRTDEKALVVPTDSANVNPGTANVSEPGTASPAILAPLAAQPDNAAPSPSKNAPGSLPPSQPAPQAPGDAPVVSGAHIVDRPGQTEIRIEMQDNSLGGIELRAHIAGDQIGASIAVEHHDAQVMLTSELPALHTALNEKNLRVDIQSVSQGSMTSMNGGPGGESGYKGFSQTPAKSPYAGQDEAPLVFQDAQGEPVDQGRPSSGLSVRA